MADPPDLVAFVLASVLIELTPGPNMAWLAILTVAEGRRAGLAAVLGVALGLAAVGTAAAFGLATIVAQSPVAWEVLRWAGVAMLFLLAWEGWRAAGQDGAGQEQAEPGGLGPGGAFGRGLLTNLLNPKAALFFVAVLPAFSDPAAPILRQTLVLTAVYVAVATAIHGGIVALASAARQVVAAPARARTVRRVLSAGLAAVAVWFAIATAR